MSNLQEAIQLIKQGYSKIILRYNNIGDAEAKDLAEAIAQSTSLISIDLSGNQIGDAGVKAIAEAIIQSTSLTSIDLHNNQIGDAGARDLAKAIAQSTSLTSINLWYNNIGPAGAKDLAEAIAQSTSLTSIDLSYNNIGAAGARAVANAIKKSTSLSFINLFGNDIGDTNKEIEEEIQINSVIAKINQKKTDAELRAEGFKDAVIENAKAKNEKEINFEEYIEDNPRCIKSEESFELCKENYCSLAKKECAGKTFPVYEDFQNTEL